MIPRSSRRPEMIGLERMSVAGLDNDVAVTVIGGGATGVELAGSLADLRNVALAASYPEIDPGRVHITLVERAPALLAPFHPGLREYTRRQLIARGVDVRLGAYPRHARLARLACAASDFLLGGRNRISALINMSWRYLVWRRGGGLIVGDGMTGLTPPTGSAGPQATNDASADPTSARDLG